MMVYVPRALISGRTPMRVKRLSPSTPSIAGCSRFCGSARTSVLPVKGETAVAAETAVSIPDCFRTSRRESRALRKRDMDAPLFINIFRFLDISDQIDLDERIPRNSTRRSYCRTHRRNASPTAFVYGIHALPILNVIEIYVHLQNFVHRRASRLKLLLKLIQHVLGVFLNRSLEVRAHARKKEQIAIGNS